MIFLGLIALFIPTWFPWIGATFFATRFGTDGLAHRILTLLQMMRAAAIAVNVTHGLGETSASFALSYAAIRSLLAVEYIRIGRRIPFARPLTGKVLDWFCIISCNLGSFIVCATTFTIHLIGNRLDHKFHNTTFGRTISHQVRAEYFPFTATDGTLYYYRTPAVEQSIWILYRTLF
jgi:hypothetical protein